MCIISSPTDQIVLLGSNLHTTTEGGEGSSTSSYNGGDGGDIHLIGGPSAGSRAINDRAGHILLDGGTSSGVGVGGSIKIQSGSGSESGVILLQTRDEKFGRPSGPIAIKTGDTADGGSGELTLSTGSATRDKGRAGAINIQGGATGSVFTRGIHYPNPYSTEPVSEGGEISLVAGTSYSGIGGTLGLTGGMGSKGGGDLNVTAGEGMSGSTGGDTLVYGGYSKSTGGSTIVQGGTGGGHGGDVYLRGGTTTGISRGGDARVESGDSLGSGSGSVIVQSSDSEWKKSGDVNLVSGSSSVTTGNVQVGSGGISRGQGRSGNVEVVTGDGSTSGKISLVSGGSYAENSGDVSLSSGEVSGYSSRGDSGAISLSTADSGQSSRGNSGEINLTTGTSTTGKSGGISFQAGHSKGGGGDVYLKASNSHSDGGSIELQSGSSGFSKAGDITLKTGHAPSSTTSSDGGNINIMASTVDSWLTGVYGSKKTESKEINFGFDHESTSGSQTRNVALQVKKTNDSAMRVVSSVPGEIALLLVVFSYFSLAI